MQQYRAQQPEMVHHQIQVQQAFQQPKPFSYLPQEQPHLQQPSCPPLPQKQALGEQHRHQLQNLQLSHCLPMEQQHKRESYSQSQEQEYNNLQQKMQEQQHMQHLYHHQTQEQLLQQQQHRHPQQHSQQQRFYQQEAQNQLQQQHQPHVQQHLEEKHLNQLQEYPIQTLHYKQDLQEQQHILPQRPLQQQQQQQLNTQLQEQQGFQTLLYRREQQQQLQEMRSYQPQEQLQEMRYQPQEQQQVHPQQPQEQQHIQQTHSCQSQEQQHLQKLPFYQLQEQLHLHLQQMLPPQPQKQQYSQQGQPHQPHTQQLLNTQLKEQQSFQKLLSSEVQEQQRFQQMRPYQPHKQQQVYPHHSQEQQQLPQQLHPPPLQEQQHLQQIQPHQSQEMQKLLQLHSHKLEEQQQIKQMQSRQHQENLHQENLLRVQQQTSQGQTLQLQVGQLIQQLDHKQECSHPLQQQQQQYLTLQQQKHHQLLQLHHLQNEQQQNTVNPKDLQSSGYPSARSDTLSVNQGVAFPPLGNREFQPLSEQSKSELFSASLICRNNVSGTLQFPSGNKGIDLSHGTQKMNVSALSGSVPATNVHKPIQPQPERFPSFNVQGSHPADQILTTNVNAEHQLSLAGGLRVPFDGVYIAGRQQTYLDRTVNQHELVVNKDFPLLKPETDKQFSQLNKEDILCNNSRTEHSHFLLTPNQSVQKDVHFEKCGIELHLSGNPDLLMQLPRTEMQLSRPRQEEEVLFSVMSPSQCTLKKDGSGFKEPTSWLSGRKIYCSDEGAQKERHRDECLPSEVGHSDAAVRSDDTVDYDSSVDIRDLEPAEQIYEDEQWLKKFLSRKRTKTRLKPQLPVVSPSVNDAREVLYSTLKLVSELSSLCQTLKQNMENETVWAETFNKAARVKKELLGKIEILRDATYIESVKKKVVKINRKRDRIRRKKQEQILEKEERDARAAKRLAKIDAWRMRCVQEAEEADLERELKATADRVLSEVRKKQADTKRVVDILRAVEKLRKLRKEAAARKDIYPSVAADEAFNAHLLRLRKLIKKRTALYETEERTLKVMLAGEQEEERQREREKKLRKEKERVLQQKKEIESLLFGEPDDLPPLHPLQPFRQYYLQASDSLPALVQIRREWDQYLVPEDYPDGSFIPRGWILPAPPSADSWASTLKLVD
ncbi:programmed cell death protein 7 [Protopterus annectens]|uniref:programmed cell death protein 7 n=1 Tax=Protopterus annectens TaxID=7888 RepID=UPI001CF94822|nr:programmed cell death protein 7 [Protopterus annectens]XP_043934309.1 programmed cell death protein 7 [Protopterus annectens]XP_043934310.1 programmed cell death protein 7 [Protopterus annectens]XP_043934311.1 programmed cell death protein 7 [Protopterus annectens]XP_043934312.1 programmed cell death protein 7 [Protopterus annectens]